MPDCWWSSPWRRERQLARRPLLLTASTTTTQPSQFPLSSVLLQFRAPPNFAILRKGRRSRSSRRRGAPSSRLSFLIVDRCSSSSNLAETQVSASVPPIHFPEHILTHPGAAPAHSLSTSTHHRLCLPPAAGVAAPAVRSAVEHLLRLGTPPPHAA